MRAPASAGPAWVRRGWRLPPQQVSAQPPEPLGRRSLNFEASASPRAARLLARRWYPAACPEGIPLPRPGLGELGGVGGGGCVCAVSPKFVPVQAIEPPRDLG